MVVIQSYMELMFFPALAVAFLIGGAFGTRFALNDPKRALYWKRRAKAAEGQLRAALRKPPNVI